jgi:hypothetical protein
MEPDLVSIAEALIRCSAKEKECAKQGHPNAVQQTIFQYRGNPRASMYCPDCGSMYDRCLTPEESKEWYRRLDEPMTV